jgi:hypothetical protein
MARPSHQWPREARASTLTLVVATSLLALGAACSQKAQEPSAARPAQLEPVPGGSAIEPLPDPELVGGHVGRAPRRITTAQLKSSILVATGREWSQLENLAASLGRADYALVNAEATETNLVFAKFLEDGAREVCLAAADADLAQKEVDKRVLSPEVPASTDLAAIDDETLRKNLTYLSTRFWGEPLAGEELATWAATFKSIADRAKAVKKPREAWGAICIALMTDARFITY